MDAVINLFEVNLCGQKHNKVEKMIQDYKKNTEAYKKNIDNKESEVKQLSEKYRIEEQKLSNKKDKNDQFDKLNKLKSQIDELDKQYVDYVEYLKKRKVFRIGSLTLILAVCMISVILNMTVIKNNMISNQNNLYQQELDSMRNLIEQYNDSN